MTALIEHGEANQSAAPAHASAVVPALRVTTRRRDTSLASMGQMLRRLFEMYGLDAVVIAHQAGVDLARFPGPADRIEVDRIEAMLRVAIPLIGDPAFGLQAARCWHPGNLGVLGHAWLASSTLRSGLKRLSRYAHIVGERTSVRIDETRRGIKVSTRRTRADSATAAVFVDMTLSLVLDMCRMNGGAVLRPVSASLRRRKPVHAEAYERFFGCVVGFGAAKDAFVLSATDADRPLSSSNRQLAAVFDRMLDAELGRLNKADVVSRCKTAVLEHLASGEVTEQDTAKRLHMSARTLQRKLADAETTYSLLVDDTRKDLALRYLEDPHRSITDITYSLGFSQPSSYARAFKRWTGFTPSEYRERPTGSH